MSAGIPAFGRRRLARHRDRLAEVRPPHS